MSLDGAGLDETEDEETGSDEGVEGSMVEEGGSGKRERKGTKQRRVMGEKGTKNKCRSSGETRTNERGNRKTDQEGRTAEKGRKLSFAKELQEFDQALMSATASEYTRSFASRARRRR